MLTIQRTVNIPPDRRLTLILPETVPAGQIEVVLTFPVPAEKPIAEKDYYDSKLFSTIEELKQDAAQKAEERAAFKRVTGKDYFEAFCSSMKTHVFDEIDGVEYQRSIRDEWPD